MQVFLGGGLYLLCTASRGRISEEMLMESGGGSKSYRDATPSQVGTAGIVNPEDSGRKYWDCHLASYRLRCAATVTYGKNKDKKLIAAF